MKLIIGEPLRNNIQRVYQSKLINFKLDNTYENFLKDLYAFHDQDFTNLETILYKLHQFFDEHEFLICFIPISLYTLSIFEYSVATRLVCNTDDMQLRLKVNHVSTYLYFIH